MSRTVKRIQRGFKRVTDFHGRNMVKGIRKIIQSGQDITKSVEQLITDSLEDIDNRLNKLPQEDADEEFEEENDSESNVLIDYCFGQIYGPNYGIRTLLEFEEECEEGVTCAEDIDASDDLNSNSGDISNGLCNVLLS